MQSISCLRDKFQTRLFKLASVGMIAVLLVGAVFAAQPVSPARAAVTCTSVADGDWNTIATWDCGHVPTSADDVVVDYLVTITTDQSAAALTITQYGTLMFTAPKTLSISGNLDIVGILDTSQPGATPNTIVLNGTNQTISTPEWVDFYNLTKTTAAADTLTFNAGTTNGVHVTGTLTLQGATNQYLSLRSDTSGMQWQINPENTPVIDWVDVQDSNNTNTNKIDGTNLANSGNNTGWLGHTATTTVVTTDKTPASYGVPVTFTATVSDTAAAGTLAFKDGTDDIPGCDAVSAIGGSGVCIVPNLLAGTLSSGSHSITAIYSGDPALAASTSAPLIQAVNTPTTTTLVGGTGSSIVGSPVTFNASVLPAIAQGTVTFSNGGTDLCVAVPVVNGKASCTTSSMPVGMNQQIQAMFNPAAGFDGSMSNFGFWTVDLQIPSVTLSTSASPATINTAVTFRVTLPDAATGTVTFKDGNTVIASCSALTVTPGTPTDCKISNLAVGPHSISAIYSGDPAFRLSPSNTVDQVVELQTSGILVASSENPIVFGKAVTFTAQVPATATGTVTFKDGSTSIATCTALPITPGQPVTCTLSNLAVGAHSITAVYSGDGLFTNSVSKPLAQVIDPLPNTTRYIFIPVITR